MFRVFFDSLKHLVTKRRVRQRLLHGVRMDLPAPRALQIHDMAEAEKWRAFKFAWQSYALGKAITTKDDKIQVATLLTVIGEEARTVYQTFQWDNDGEEDKIEAVVQKFEDYCEPRKNVPFSRYFFHQRQQQQGETYEKHKKELRRLARTFVFASITPEEIIRDRLVFGIRDARVRERLLREEKLTMKKMDEVCQAAESTRSHLSAIDKDGRCEEAAVRSIAQPRPGQMTSQPMTRRSCE